MTAAEFQQKQAKNLKASTNEIVAGVNATTEAPSTKAVEKQDKMLTNLTEAVNNGKWAKSLGNYTLSDWKRDMTEKGVKRIGTGIDAAAGKVRNFASVLLPHAYAIRDEVSGMADMTLDDSEARMVHAMRRMSELRYK